LHIRLGFQQVSKGIPHYLMMVGKDKCQFFAHVPNLPGFLCLGAP
jgi:hypothetical protein